MHPDEFKAGPFGYGLLWWIWDGAANTGPYRGAYTGIGAVGQFITVLPALDMVVAHKTRQGGASVSRERIPGAGRCAHCREVQEWPLNRRRRP